MNDQAGTYDGNSPLPERPQYFPQNPASTNCPKALFKGNSVLLRESFIPAQRVPDLKKI